MVVMSLFHIFLNAKATGIKENNSAYRSEIKKRDSILFSQLTKIENKSLSTSIISMLKESKLNVKRINNEKREINRAHSFRGRSSKHFWICFFGLVTALLFFSIKSLFDDIKNGSTYRFQFVSITGIIVSFFWIIHLIFFTQKDFQKNSYILLILICACLCSIFIYFLVKYYTYKDDIILKQLSLLERIKTVHYPKIAVKAMYAEKYGKSVTSVKELQKAAEDFQDDLLETLKE